MAKLGITFEQFSPNIDESPLPNEAAKDLALRLSKEKALAAQQKYPGKIIIASDQCAQITIESKDTNIANNSPVEDAVSSFLSKPGSVQRAIEQLSKASGKCVAFYTGICVINTKEDGSTIIQNDVEITKVYFRLLNNKQIVNYVNKELPLDCAGSFKAEGLGISLFTKLQSDDPNALIGLPLIKLCALLKNIDVDVLNL